MPDIPGNSSTNSTITVGGSASDVLETVNDHDWFRIELVAGQKITITLNGITLVDPYVRVRDANGIELAENDDVSSGAIRDSRLVFTAPTTGTYYIDVAAWVPPPDHADFPGYTGTYQLNVAAWTPPPVASYVTVAEHLTSGYWGGDTHRFNVTQGGTITYDFHSAADTNGVTADGQALANEALALWSDITGITFVQVASGGQITFSDNEEGAFSEGNWSNGIISTTHVNVSTQWLTTNGRTLDSYSFQTYVHEIGHALGLGHGGHYNSTATYDGDALFANDGWSSTVMSYFDQNESTYFNDLGFTRAYVVTPMLADIRGMATLYGLSTTTRTGDTIYGFGNNSGRSVYTSSVGSTLTALTIFDSGGIDTLNYSGLASNQLLNLAPETFSNVGGGIGNVTIAFNTIIENAVGGSGNDILLGNSADNVLDGGAGNDVLDGLGGNDTLIGGFGADTLTGGAGADLLSGTAAGLSGDTITDFAAGDRIVITDATLGGFTFNLSGSTLTYTGGTLTLTGGVSGTLVASAAAGGGVQLTIQALMQPINDARHDFNGDGRSDIMWRNDNGAFSVWQGAADGGFAASPLSDSMISISWRVVGSGDFNGDGRDDVLWRHSSGAFSEWLGLANGGFVANAAADAVVGLDWQVSATGDFNGDSFDDVVWRSDLGGVMGWFGQANGGFSGNPFSNTSVATSWHIIGAGDFNGDGRDDILWRNDSGAFSVWSGKADGGFMANPNSDTSIANSWHVAGTGDFNGDGRDDVLWRNDSGAFSAWHGQADGGFVASPNSNTTIASSWHVAGTGDFNGDGRDDVLWRSDSGAFSAWHGQADGGFVANAHSNTVIATSWHVQSPDTYLL